MAIPTSVTVQEASQAQAEAGTDNTTVMTPLRTAQAIAALATGVSNTAWTAYTPTVGAGSGALTTASAAGCYKIIGKTCFVRINIVITNNGTAGGYLYASLPVIPAAFEYNLSIRNTGTDVALNAYIPASTADVIIVNTSGGYPGANSTTFNMSGVYETV